MKRIIILLLSLILFGICKSQTLSVSSFKLLDTDLTANTSGTMEIDQNGETAALIKVVTTQTGFTFDGGALGIVKTSQKPSEIWVYVPRGLKKITISHPQLGMLRDYYLNIPIEAARTYEMCLFSGEVHTFVKQARTSQFVVFQLVPSNAVVELDGEMLETYEGTATKLMKFGTYNYKINAPNFLPEAGTVVVDNPMEKHIINIELKPNYSKVTLFTDPDAEVWVNGKKRSLGSWTGELGSGTYEFEAKKLNHRSMSITQDIVVTNEPITINLPQPIPIVGEVTINSNPAIADVYIDDKLMGQSPLVISDLLIGEHRISIRKSGFYENKSVIAVKEREMTKFSVKLEKEDSRQNVFNNNDGLIKIGERKLGATGKRTKDGGDYYGNLKSGKPGGYGRAIYQNGNIYEGDYVNGKRQGYGIYKFNNGEWYEGEWYLDQQSGKGTYYFANNNKYVGLWFRDYMHGQGVMYYYNGDKYDGEWKMDKRSGEGIYTFSNGAYYKGQWSNDRKNGKGLFDWGDGSTYDGEWKDNMRFGFGTMKFANGDIYTGQWANDNYNGKGKLTKENGEILEGIFRDGKLINTNK